MPISFHVQFRMAPRWFFLRFVVIQEGPPISAPFALEFLRGLSKVSGLTKRFNSTCSRALRTMLLTGVFATVIINETSLRVGFLTFNLWFSRLTETIAHEQESVQHKTASYRSTAAACPSSPRVSFVTAAQPADILAFVSISGFLDLLLMLGSNLRISSSARSGRTLSTAFI